MPLSAVSPNIQEPQSPSKKRTLDEFAGMEPGELPGLKSIEDSRDAQNKENGIAPNPTDISPSSFTVKSASLNPPGSSLADPKSTSPKPKSSQNSISAFFPPSSHSTTPKQPSSVGDKMPHASSPTNTIVQSAKRKLDNDENSPLSPARLQGVSEVASAPDASQKPTAKPSDQQPPKKKRATKEEIEAKKKEEARIKQEKETRIKQEKEALKAAKAEKAAKLEAEKQQKAEEREKKRRLKAEEEAKKEAKKVEEQAEKDKKARSQPTLGSFFKKTATPKEEKADIATSQPTITPPEKPAAKEVSFYAQLFQPFFVKDQVTLAQLFHADEESREAKGRIFEEYVDHKRGDVEVKPFRPLEALDLPFIIPRGQTYPTVRSVMAGFNESSSRQPINLTTDSQNAQIRSVREVLQEIPVKFLCFKEDVRPPYYGTVSNVNGGLASLRKLARNPVARDVLPLNYDYDSEAEWQEDDGEDVDLLDDDEEDVDNDEDMDDFLDDSEDVGLTRLPLVSGLEPESSGICWENGKRLGPSAHMYKFRMEFILDTLDHHSGIDPFSTEYWEPVKPATALAALTPNASKANSMLKSMAPPAPADALKMLAASATNAPHKSGRSATVVLKGDMVQKLKEMVLDKKSLSKVGIVELFSSEHKVPKAAIKNTLEIIAQKAGKEWALRPNA